MSRTWRMERTEKTFAMAARASLIPCLLIAAGTVWTPAWADEFVARSTTIPERKAVFARVESRNVVPARARIGGTIREIRVSEGSEVKEGEVIAVVVDDKLALELNAAEARVRELKSQLENARTEYDRAQALLSRGVVSQTRVDQVKTQYDVAASQVAAAEADQAVVTQRGREGEIVAPATGRILTVPVTLGSVIMAGEPVARVATGQYFLRLSLPERHATEIVQGGTVLVGERGLVPSAGGDSEALRPGRIVKVYPEIESGRVMADVDVTGLGDYFVNERTLVWIPVGKRSAITVPPKAVFTRHGIDYVRLARAEGTLDVAVIKGESFEEGGESRIEILSGLRDGDKVVLP